MTEAITGGCACGAIRYKATGQPKYMGNCHCRDCQQATGSAFFPAVLVLTDEFTLESGQPKWFDRVADSGNTLSRGFCPDCGSPIFLKNPARAGGIVLYAGSLDDPSIYRPSRNIYLKSAQHWAWMDDRLPQFEALP